MRALAIIGGDRRQLCMAKTLSERGFSVQTLGLSTVETEPLTRVTNGAEAVILPVPATRDGEQIPTPLAKQSGLRFSELLACLASSVLLLGGMLPDEWVGAFAAQGGRSVDYYRGEIVPLRNALPTVEGALRLAMEALPITLCGSRLAVIGYGRIGALLTEKLIALGARVTVLARSSVARIAAGLHGAEALPIGPDAMRSLVDCRLVFNTVPARVLGAEDLRALSVGCVLMELASGCGGFDPKDAENAGLRVIPAPALPRFYPETAGQILADAVCGCLCGNGTTL